MGINPEWMFHGYHEAIVVQRNAHSLLTTMDKSVKHILNFVFAPPFVPGPHEISRTDVLHRRRSRKTQNRGPSCKALWDKLDFVFLWLFKSGSSLKHQIVVSCFWSRCTRCANLRSAARRCPMRLTAALTVA